MFTFPPPPCLPPIEIGRMVTPSGAGYDFEKHGSHCIQSGLQCEQSIANKYNNDQYYNYIIWHYYFKNHIQYCKPVVGIGGHDSN